jgi:hypothetical protein
MLVDIAGRGDRRILPWLALAIGLAATGHLAWEAAQLPLYTLWSTGTARVRVCADPLHRRRCPDHGRHILGGGGARAALALARLRLADGARRDPPWSRLHHSQRMAQCRNPPDLVLRRGDARRSLARDQPRTAAAMAGGSGPGFCHRRPPIPPHNPAVTLIGRPASPADGLVLCGIPSLFQPFGET